MKLLCDVMCRCQALDDISKSLDSIKVMLCGSGDHEPHAETTAQLAQEVYTSLLIQLLIEHLSIIDFEVPSLVSY